MEKLKKSCTPEGKKNYRILNDELRKTTDKKTGGMNSA